MGNITQYKFHITETAANRQRDDEIIAIDLIRNKEDIISV